MYLSTVKMRQELLTTPSLGSLLKLFLELTMAMRLYYLDGWILSIRIYPVQKTERLETCVWRQSILKCCSVTYRELVLTLPEFLFQWFSKEQAYLSTQLYSRLIMLLPNKEF